MTSTDDGPDEDQVDQSKLTCFVIGPIGNRHAPDGSGERETYEESLRVMEEVIEPACGRLGLDPVRADALARAGEITEQIFHRLRDDDVVIADLTGANANVMYELGLRHTRQKLTVQIGEYGRLPFDITTIRTIQFSRSRVGLIDARDELTRVLEAGLAGGYDPVTATRVWGNLGDATVAEAAQPNEEATDHERVGTSDDRGFIDILAEAEERQEPLNDALNDVNRCMEQLTHLAQQASEQTARSDAAGKGMRGRLQVLTSYGTGLQKVAREMEASVDEYISALQSVSDGTLAIIGRMEDDPNELAAGRDFGMVVRRLAESTREGMASSSAMVESIRENAQLSRVIREPSRRLTAALDRFAKATSTIDEWDRHLQALGVPMPPPDWEPELTASPASGSPTEDGSDTDGTAQAGEPRQEDDETQD